MNTDKALHIVLPCSDLASLNAAFPVAQVLTRTLNARLHILSAPAQLADIEGFMLALSLPSGEREAIDIEPASADLVDASVDKARNWPHSVVILAARFRDEEQAAHAQSPEAIARRMLEKCAWPILVVPPDRDMRGWRWRRELLPQDGTADCVCALAEVIDHSSQLGIDNLVLRVAGANVGQPTEPGSLPTPRYMDHPHYEWESWQQEFLDRIRGSGAQIGKGRLTLLMASGDPAAEALRVANEKKVDMIVLPWHCAIGSGRAMLIKAILQGTPCPVLLLPEHAPHIHASD